MKKIILSLLILSLGGMAFAAKYKVNSSGVVKTQSGQVISSPANTVNQNYYNNYQAQNYVNSNVVNQDPAGIVEIVMDYSGSMTNWIGVAKRSMSAIISQIPQDTQLGFRVFGHDSYGNNPQSTVKEVKTIIKNGSKYKVTTEKSALGSTTGVCSATQQVAPIVAANSVSILNGMNSVNIGGATPLTYALDRTVNNDFARFDAYTPKKIVLITDGGENCGGDPCAFARNLMKKRSDVHIDVVLVSSNSRALTCLSQTTGGHFYTVDNLSDFYNTMTQSIQSQPSENMVPKQNYEFIGE